MNRKLLALAVSASASLLSACGGDSSSADSTASPAERLGIECQSVTTDNSTPAGVLQLNVIDRYVSGNDFATSSAEIVSYDSCSDQLYVVNAESASVDVLSLATANSAPDKAGTIDLQAAATAAGVEIGAANSVSVKKGLVAVAIEARVKQNPGLIALYRSDDLSLLATYPAGALPDMVTLSADGHYILTANEGEPSADYSNDPEGSVTIVDISAGFDAASAVVHQVTFADFNTGGSRATELPANVRISGPSATSVAQDLEPEYLTLNADGNKAWVALQENNAMAIIDLASASVDAIVGLGDKMWDNASGNRLDASNKDDGTGQFASYAQLAGYYMPDTLASFEQDGQTYILSANEGDGREYIYTTTQETCDNAGHLWDGTDYSGTAGYTTAEEDCISHVDELRGGDLYDLVDAAHPLKDALDDKNQLKRLKFVADKDSYAAGEVLHAFGGRSFSIWNASAELVFDSGDDIAQRVYAADAGNFNSDNESNDSADSRSDDKGTEPEAIEVAQIGSRIFAFVGLERQGGIMVYDITDPAAPVFQSYLNNRDFTAAVCTDVNTDGECTNDTYNSAAGDLGPESIEYFSRNGKHYIAVGNEVSGTTTVYELTFSSEV